MKLNNDDFDEYTNRDHSDQLQMSKFLQVSKEAQRWCELMECETVSDLNELILNGKIRELIRINEALHEKSFSKIADMICYKGAKAVVLAGPSSSGKTTSANRLATQLRVHGRKPILLSLDDYYVDRDKIAPDADGKMDYEHINTIDTALFRKHMQQLISGKPVVLPLFNFKSGRRQWQSKAVQMTENTVFIIEGLHALNPILLPQNLESALVFRLYVCPLLPLNMDAHNRISGSLLRLLRRIVRDYENRGASVQQTIQMWDSVRRGEKAWIYPFQESADFIFNSATLYELSILKKHIFPLLNAIQPEDAYYPETSKLVNALESVLEAEVEDEIPPTSIVREFIGGNAFYK